MKYRQTSRRKQHTMYKAAEDKQGRPYTPWITTGTARLRFGHGAHRCPKNQNKTKTNPAKQNKHGY